MQLLKELRSTKLYQELAVRMGCHPSHGSSSETRPPDHAAMLLLLSDWGTQTAREVSPDLFSFSMNVAFSVDVG